MKTKEIKLAALHKAKLKIIYVDEFRVNAILIYKNTKSLLTWYNNYFIEMDLTYYVDDEILGILLDEIMDICAVYHHYEMGG